LVLAQLKIQGRMNQIPFRMLRQGLFLACLALVGGQGLTHSLAAVYPGNQDASHGGEIGKGSLDLKDNGVTVTATLTRGTATFDGILVLFIDCAPGGFTSTGVFSDISSDLARAITGLDRTGSQRNTANFAPGFAADYAVAVGVDTGGAIYHLVQNGSSAVLQYVGAVTLNPHDAQNYASYTFTFDWTSIGLPKVKTNFFKFESTYGSVLGRRSTESFETLTGSGDWGGTLNFSNYHVYGVDPVPETANAALAVFGGMIVVAGSVGSLRRVLKKERGR
jgi:hypothetical protein